MQNLFTGYGFTSSPGLRDCFFRREQSGEWVMLVKIPDGYGNNTPYEDEKDIGGLFAVASSFMEDMDDTFILLKDWINNNEDYSADPERPDMIEEILPWDIAIKQNRYQQDIFIPIKINDIRETM